MALINCPECDEEISDSTLICQKCGYQINKPQRTLFGKLIKWTFILFNIFMFWILFIGVDSTNATNGAEAVGEGIGIMIILILWFIGAGILGMLVFFTKARFKS